MDFSERRANMLYKNSQGGRIMVKITLPQAEDGGQAEKLYSLLLKEYMEAAKKYIERRGDSAFLIFNVTYTRAEDLKYVKINRRSSLTLGGATVSRADYTDVFVKRDMRLKS